MGLTNDLPWNDRQTSLIGVTTFCIVISTFAVALRLLARRYLHVKLWWDDYTTIIALIFSYFPNILTIMAVRAGLGRHMTDASPEQGRYIGVTVFFHEITWYISFCSIIITILILYIRIFPTSWLQRTCRWMMCFTLVWMILNVLIVTFQCTPVQYFWDPRGDGHCIHANEYYAITCAISMVMIIVIFALPLPIVSKLQISRSKKWGLGLAFTVGSFACVSSVLRVVLVLRIDHNDQTWTLAPAVLWGCLEVSVGVVSACIPSLMPLLMVFIGRRVRVQSNESPRPRQVRYDQNDDLKPTRSPRKPFSHLMSLRDLETLPEALETPNAVPNSITRDDDDGAKLFDRAKNRGDIFVTEQFQVSDNSSHQSS